MYYVNERWLGGLLTNFTTIQRSIARLRDLEAMATDGRYEFMPKKEIARAEKEKRKLQKNLEGIRNMGRLPDALFVVDTRKEKIAVDEARKLKIPVVGVVDTNCDPEEVDFVIPGNDDALRAIRLFAARVADAVHRWPWRTRISAGGSGDGRCRSGRGRRSESHGAARQPAAPAATQRGASPAGLTDSGTLSRLCAGWDPRPALFMYESGVRRRTWCIVRSAESTCGDLSRRAEFWLELSRR